MKGKAISIHSDVLRVRACATVLHKNSETSNVPVQTIGNACSNLDRRFDFGKPIRNTVHETGSVHSVGVSNVGVANKFPKVIAT